MTSRRPATHDRRRESRPRRRGHECECTRRRYRTLRDTARAEMTEARPCSRVRCWRLPRASRAAAAGSRRSWPPRPRRFDSKRAPAEPCRAKRTARTLAHDRRPAVSAATRPRTPLPALQWRVHAHRRTGDLVPNGTLTLPNRRTSSHAKPVRLRGIHEQLPRCRAARSSQFQRTRRPRGLVRERADSRRSPRTWQPVTFEPNAVASSNAASRAKTHSGRSAVGTRITDMIKTPPLTGHHPRRPQALQ
jgi:hypothetical protein